MIAKCIRRCWDGKKARRYYPGDQDDINPNSPIAKYFDIPKEEPKEAKADGGKAAKADGSKTEQKQ